MKKNKPKRSLSVVIITFLTVILVFQVLGILVQLSKSYDENRFYESDYTGTLRREDYSDIIYEYYRVIYWDIKPSKNYTEQTEVGHYYSKAILANAYKNVGDNKKYKSLKVEIDSVRSSIPGYEKYLDDIDSKIETKTF